jgi:HD-like signal output (HDOD) protein
MDLRSLIDLPSQLPTVPGVTQRVIASFGSEDVTTGEIAALVEADPVLCAKLLRLANSSYFQVARSVESVEDAFRILGLAMVRHLVLAGALAGTFANVPGVDLHQFWTYSLYTACTARWLADHSTGNRDQAFMLGLMHAIGQLHLHRVAPAAAVALDQQVHLLAAERAALEDRALGFNALHVSAALAAVWNFPQSLVQPLEQLANPLAAPDYSSAAATVHLSAWHARNTVLAVPQAQWRLGYPEAVGRKLGISASWVISDAKDTHTSDLPVIPPLQELTRGMEGMLN